MLGLTSVFATLGLVSLPSLLVPDGRPDQRGHPPGRPRRRASTTRSSTCAVNATSAGPGAARSASLARRRRHLRPRGPALGPHGDDRDGRDVLLRRHDVHVVRDRRHDGRLRRHDRLAHRAAGRPVGARRPSSNAASRSCAAAARAGRRGQPPLGRHPAARAAAPGHLDGRLHRRPRGPRPAGAPAPPAQSGLDAMPKSQPELQAFHRLDDVLPRRRDRGRRGRALRRPRPPPAPPSAT